MDLFALKNKDLRPPVNATVRQWLAKITQIPIPELVDPVPPPAAVADVAYGDLGDHRWDELTVIPNAPALVPARRAILASLRKGIGEIWSTYPTMLDVNPTVDDTSIRDVSIQKLPACQAVHVKRQVPPSMSGMRLHLGNPAIESVMHLTHRVNVADGNWATMSLQPERSTMRWEQFLALAPHPGAYVWAEVVDVGSRPRPILVELLDDCKQGIVEALSETVVGPPAANEWEQKNIFYQPFASRMHLTDVCEFRSQDVGHHLVYMLTWIDPSKVTTDDREFRLETLKNREFTNCLYDSKDGLSKGSNPRSTWVVAHTHPGSLLLIPPGTLVVEYSSGAAITTEGRFIPWACTTLIGRVSLSPHDYILMAMLSTAARYEQSGNATAAEIKALARLVHGKKLRPPSEAQTYESNWKEFEERVQAICRLYLTD
ncbi:hypothetical protein FRC01_003426 [Tulasnella sp. 417]|nr:hypothetical protein FRC01_003426 [Tulasnella sp. 417]